MPDERLNQLVENPSGTTYDLTLGYNYNPAGQIVGTTRSNDAYAWGGHYTVNRSYSANGLNQYSAAGSAGFTYDLNGNLRTSPGLGTNETLTHSYDVENRLVQRTSDGGGSTATLAYDPLGRLFSLAANGVTTTFLYDGDALVAEYDAAGAMMATPTLACRFSTR